MKTMDRIAHARIGAFIAIVAAVTSVSFANQPPVVDAGQDQSDVSVDAISYLLGTVDDDSTGLDALTIRWKQVSGAVKAALDDSSSSTTRVVFPDSGAYGFELRVGDGRLWSADTVVWRVRRSLPFRILTPPEGAGVAVGRSCIVRWQMDPSVPCDIAYSIDDGRRWTAINTMGAKTDSVTWDVDPTLPPNTRGMLKVQEYQGPQETTSSFTFVVTADVARRPALTSGRGRIVVDPAGVVRDRDGSGVYRVTTVGLTGRATAAALVVGPDGVGLSSARAQEPLLYRVIDDNGRRESGMVTSVRRR